MTFQEFVHVDAAIYFCYSQSECLCSPINLPIKPAACLSVFSARVLIWTSLEYLSQFFLSLTWSPPNSLSAAAQPSLYVTQRFFYVLWFMHGCTHIHIFHTFYPLPSIKDSWFRIWPFTSSLLSLPCPSPVSVSARAIVMHMEPTEWVYVWGVQGKCQLTKALRYHEALSILSVFRVTLGSVSYFVITVYRHFHCKISIF